MMLFERFLESPNEENYCSLDYAFKLFWFRKKILQYAIQTIRFYTFDVLSTYKNHYKKNYYVLDDHEKNVHSTKSIYDNHSKESNNHIYKSLSDLIEDEQLYSAFNELSPKQKHILNLFYIQGFTNREIAEYYGQSDQNISSIHKKILKQLKGKVCKK